MIGFNLTFGKSSVTTTVYHDCHSGWHFESDAFQVERAQRPGGREQGQGQARGPKYSVASAARPLARAVPVPQWQLQVEAPSPHKLKLLNASDIASASAVAQLPSQVEVAITSTTMIHWQ